MATIPAIRYCAVRRWEACQSHWRWQAVSRGWRGIQHSVCWVWHERALPHLEVLRTKIEHSRFHVRDASERRVDQRGPDRRKNPAKSRKMAATAVAPIRNPADGLSVTVSIGVAEPASASQPPQDVIEAADQALYRAKRGGRNRVENGS